MAACVLISGLRFKEMATLESLRDDDGLVPVSALMIDSANPRNLSLKSCGKQVYLEPRIFGVADIILGRPDLWEMAKIRVSSEKRGLKGAPVYGITFKKALAKLESLCSGSVLKSRYTVTDEQTLRDNGFCATLVAHLQKKTNYIQIEAWQYISEDSFTSYLHGTTKNTSGPFTHFDGATIRHSVAEQESMFVHGSKEKGSEYLKQFRLDGEISLHDVIVLAEAFLPNEKLAIEYFEESVESDI